MSAPTRRGVRPPVLARLALVLALAGLVTAGAAPAPAPAAAVAPDVDPAPTTDPVDGAGPLDITEVSLGQRDMRMVLRVVSNGVWDSRELTAVAGRELCVSLVHGEPALPRARVCVTRRSARTALELIPLAEDGTAGTPRPLAADPSRPEPTVLEMTFLPVAAGLAIGPYAWYADSAWTDHAACAATCRDRAPDSGAVDAEVVLLATPPCFGAASRDPARPCDNPDLRTSVEPPPDRARIIATPFCDKVQHDGLITACSFGAMPADATRTFALIGDSHAANLKAALSVLTLAKRWRGVSILRSGCTTTRARPILVSPAISRDCRQWNSQVLRWLAKHPEVKTVFLSAHATARVEPVAGRTPQQTVEAGYREELRALLRQRRDVVVVRDAPASRTDKLGCVSRALAAGRSAQLACTFARAAALPPDPLLEAARALGSSRIKAIDLTRQYCSSTRCFSVVGGALVRHDKAHLTQTFAATLGPFVLRALDG